MQPAFTVRSAHHPRPGLSPSRERALTARARGVSRRHQLLEGLAGRAAYEALVSNPDGLDALDVSSIGADDAATSADDDDPPVVVSAPLSGLASTTRSVVAAGTRATSISSAPVKLDRSTVTWSPS